MTTERGTYHKGKEAIIRRKITLIRKDKGHLSEIERGNYYRVEDGIYQT